MKSSVLNQLSLYVSESADLVMSGDKTNWSKKVSTFLESTLGLEEAKTFQDLDDDWNSEGAFFAQIGRLQGLIAQGEAETENNLGSDDNVAHSDIQQSTSNSNSRKVFIVHGHDNEAKEGTARFIEKIGLQPIILHEQASSGQTIIEKFETHSGDIGFAIVVLTPDDFGGVAGAPEVAKPRARQNVILELGYFIGKLGRSRVCALHRGGIEFPSDYQGVLYVEFDDAGAWRMKLAQEFIEAKIPIELSGLISS